MLFNNKLVRFINQNRGIMVLLLSIIIFILLLIRTLNYIASTAQEESASNNNNMSEEVIKSRDTITTNTTINDNVAEENYNLISEFISYCNEGNICDAYNMLSDECKENLYPSIETFNKNYFNIVFKEKRNYEIRSWIKQNKKYTYLVEFIADILSTGNYNEDNNFEDYITIDSENEKININRYIGRVDIGKIKEIQNIKIQVNYVDIYKDYSIYNLDITNLNNKQIILDKLESTNSTYLVTNKKNKINCSNYEAGINSFKYEAGESKNIRLKFIKQYNIDITDEEMVFSNNNIGSQEIIKVEL